MNANDVESPENVKMGTGSCPFTIPSLNLSSECVWIFVPSLDLTNTKLNVICHNSGVIPTKRGSGTKAIRIFAAEVP